MSNTLYLKVTSAVLVFLCAYLSGVLPLRKNNGNGNRAFLMRGEYFSRGVFLGMASLHMLPDAYHHLKPRFLDNTYFAVVFTFLGIIASILILEKFATRALKHTEDKPHRFFPYWILLLLSIHAVLAGAVLGADENIRNILIIAFAILAHKGSEAFALMLTLKSYHLSDTTLKKILLIFSCVTPFGIFLGGILTTFIMVDNLNTPEGFFNITAAATFLYIAFFHQETALFEKGKLLPKISYFGLGFGIMALVAFYT